QPHRDAGEAAPERLSPEPGSAVADAPPRLEHRGAQGRGQRADRRVEFSPGRAGRPGQARDARVGRARDTSAALGGRRAANVQEDGRADQRRRAAAKPVLPYIGPASRDERPAPTPTPWPPSSPPRPPTTPPSAAAAPPAAR